MSAFALRSQRLCGEMSVVARTRALRIEPLHGIPEILPGDNLSAAIAHAIRSANIELETDDVLVIAQKIVSKAEGRIVRLADVTPSSEAVALAAKLGKDAAKVEVILSESRSIVAERAPMGPAGKPEGVLICEHRLGFISANAGVDESNAGEEGRLILLPEDPDRSAEQIRQDMLEEFDVAIGVVITDSFGRPWRLGVVNIAIGVAGIPAVIDVRGEKDSTGRTLHATVLAVADEIAAAAGLVMGKLDGVPAAVLKGLKWNAPAGTAKELIRKQQEDLFR